jgi:hypothetical protein
MNLPVLSESRVEGVIHAPIKLIDLADWVFTLSDKEYQECSKDHIAAGTSYLADGRRMSIHVERLDKLIVQHFVEEISGRRQCRLVSISDTFDATGQGRGQVRVMWEFFVEAIDEGCVKFSNHVEVQFMPGYEDVLHRHGVTLEQAQSDALKHLKAHNVEETVLFAKDIERKALAGRWRK